MLCILPADKSLVEFMNIRENCWATVANRIVRLIGH